jgi:glycosyltransferase involved in cell wall biosynthesis
MKFTSGAPTVRGSMSGSATTRSKAPRMRLLHLLDYEPRGTRAIDHLILGFAIQGQQRGWDVRFGFLSEPPSEFSKRLEEAGSRWYRIPHPLTFGAVRQLTRELGDFRPDVIQTSFLSAFQLPLLWLKLSRVTKHIIVIDQSSGTGPTNRGPQRLLRWVRGRLVGQIVDAVAPVSNYIRRRDIERVYLPAEKVITIHNGLKFDRFSSPTRTNSDHVRIVYAGQLIPEKGVHTLLEALRVLRERKLTPYDLRIAGRGHQRAELEQMTHSAGLPNVEFLGHVDDIPSLFASADIVVVPSMWAEAFGYVAIEAMASGAAVITSDAGGLPEVVGDMGLCYPAGDAQALANHLDHLIRNPNERRERGIGGRARAEQDFQLDMKVNKHLDLCVAVLKRMSLRNFRFGMVESSV